MSSEAGCKVIGSERADGAKREELMVQLYYDRADAARFDAGAARMIERAIARLAADADDAATARSPADRDGNCSLH